MIQKSEMDQIMGMDEGEEEYGKGNDTYRNEE